MAQPRKILMLSGLQVFPAESGGQLRSGSLVTALAEHGYEVRLWSMVGRKPDYQAGKASECVRVAPRIEEWIDRRRWWAGLQFLAYRLNLPPLWITFVLMLFTPKKLAEWLDWCDVVIVDFPFLYPPIRGLKKPVVMNTHNVEADLWKNRLVARIVAAIERRAAAAVSAVIACSELDRAYFGLQIGEARTMTVPNGIDVRRFEGIRTHRKSLRAAFGFKEHDRILLFAASSFGPNVEALAWLRTFCEKHQELLQKRGYQFLVAGSVCKDPFHIPCLRAVGKVPAIEPFFAVADLAYNGVFRGSGTNVKMGEFMAAQLPILTTPFGTRGFDVVDGEDCVMFTEATLAKVLAESPILSDGARLEEMARRALQKNLRDVDMRRSVDPLVAWLERN